MTSFFCRSWIVLSLVMLGASIAAAQESPGRKYALLVGVMDYDKSELKSLKYTENDVTALAAVLQQGDYERVVLMTQTIGAKKARYLPTARNIRDELKGLLEDRQPGDVLLVAFTGHGVQFKGQQEHYFCPMDARLTDRQTLVSLSDVYDELKACQAGVKLLLVDACRNDPQSDLSKSADGEKLESVTRPQAVRPPGGVAALFSCSAGQKSYESDDLKHGVFFHHVIKGLQGEAAAQDGNGAVGLLELATYTQRKVPDFVKEDIGPRVRQVPNLVGDLSGNAVLLSRRSEAAMTDEITNSIGMKLQLIPAGEFLMGSPAYEKGREDDEGPQHRVRISNPFYMGLTEVTQGEWFSVMRTKPWEGKRYVQEGDKYPATYVNWDDAIEYCRRLSALEGKRYRLPTEAEWEYSCRGGKSTAYSFGDDASELKSFGWFAENTDHIVEAGAHKVGGKQANPFGLYDMHGNVHEWCSDWYGGEYYSSSPGSDPAGVESGSSRVHRGGGWGSAAAFCRSAIRFTDVPAVRSYGLGFRVALSPSVQ